MEHQIKVFISHQSQCDASEIQNLISYLNDKGFNVQSGILSSEDFVKIIENLDYYVCVIDQESHKSEDLTREVSTAISRGKRIFGIFCPSLTIDIDLPNTLDNFSTGITEWNFEKLADGLNGADIGFCDIHGNQRKKNRNIKKAKCQ